jgi:D-threo-aldose 1-dehydrogenase
VCVDAMSIGRFDLFMLAGRYTLLDQSALDVFMPAVDAHKARVVIAGVYNSGVLATGAAGTPMFDYAPASPAIVERTRRIEEACADFGVRLPAAALHLIKLWHFSTKPFRQVFGNGCATII